MLYRKFFPHNPKYSFDKRRIVFAFGFYLASEAFFIRDSQDFLRRSIYYEWTLFVLVSGFFPSWNKLKALKIYRRLNCFLRKASREEMAYKLLNCCVINFPLLLFRLILFFRAILDEKFTARNVSCMKIQENFLKLFRFPHCWMFSMLEQIRLPFQVADELDGDSQTMMNDGYLFKKLFTFSCCLLSLSGMRMRKNSINQFSHKKFSLCE